MKATTLTMIAGLLLAASSGTAADRPNFAVIVADDVGWGDDALHGVPAARHGLDRELVAAVVRNMPQPHLLRRSPDYGEFQTRPSW